MCYMWFVFPVILAFHRWCHKWFIFLITRALHHCVICELSFSLHEPFTTDATSDLSFWSHELFTTVLYVSYLSLYMNPSPLMPQVIYLSDHTSSSPPCYMEVIFLFTWTLHHWCHKWFIFLITRALHHCVICDLSFPLYEPFTTEKLFTLPRLTMDD